MVKDVINGRSNKLLMIIGPCSAHEPAPVIKYIEKLGKLNEKVKDKLVIVPRIYTNKPRTRGVGYKGMFSQPDPNSKEDILKGIMTIRQLHIDAINISGLTAAGRDALSRKLSVCRRSAFIRRSRRSFERKSDAQIGGVGNRSPRRSKKPDGRKHTRFNEFYLCGSKPAGVQIQSLSG